MRDITPNSLWPKMVRGDIRALIVGENPWNYCCKVALNTKSASVFILVRNEHQRYPQYIVEGHRYPTGVDRYNVVPYTRLHGILWSVT